MHDDDVGRFDRWSATYDHNIAQRLLFEPVHGAVCDQLLSGERAPAVVVDVGCGTGRLLATVRAGCHRRSSWLLTRPRG